VIGQFVESALSRVAVARGDYTASDYARALGTLARAILSHRDIEPNWNRVADWLSSAGDALSMLRHLAHDGQVIRLGGSAADQRLAFRHDRVRDHILSAAAGELIRSGDIDPEVFGEPYFAEIFGAALTQEGISPRCIPAIATANPLTLFYALREFGARHTDVRAAVLSAIEAWLSIPRPTKLKNNIFGGTHSRHCPKLRLQRLSSL
jgi:hypothetical protein